MQTSLISLPQFPSFLRLAIFLKIESKVRHIHSIYFGVLAKLFSRFTFPVWAIFEEYYAIFPNHQLFLFQFWDLCQFMSFFSSVNFPAVFSLFKVLYFWYRFHGFGQDIFYFLMLEHLFLTPIVSYLFIILQLWSWYL